MANLEVIALDTATPQLRAPGGSDAYVMNSELTVNAGNVADGSSGVILNATIPAGAGSSFVWTGFNVDLTVNDSSYRKFGLPFALHNPINNPPFVTDTPFAVDESGYVYAQGIYDSNGYGTGLYHYSLDMYGLALNRKFYVYDFDNFYVAIDDYNSFGSYTGLMVKSVRTVSGTVAQLPSVAVAMEGARGFVNNATLSMALGVGTVVVGGGANKVPVYCDGTNWLIG